MLEWYLEAGVDEVASDTPVNRFAEYQAALAERQAAQKTAAPAPIAVPRPTSVASAASAPLPQPRPASATAASPFSPPAANTAQAIAKAREVAAKCSSIEELREVVAAFDGCELKKLANKTVFADGNPAAPVMFIGEAPGADEDREGIPFCGVSGQLLDKMLAAIGLSRKENSYITNMIFWRPPGNRAPTQDEIDICRPFVDRHIMLAKPKLIVLVGGISAKGMLGATDGITRLRTKTHALQVPGAEAPLTAFAMYHPAYLLRQPTHKALAWQDLLKIKNYLKEQSVL